MTSTVEEGPRSRVERSHPSEVFDNTHTVIVHVVKPTPLLAMLVRTKAWLHDEVNGADGRYHVNFDQQTRTLTFSFSDANTAFWFRMRWGGV